MDFCGNAVKLLMQAAHRRFGTLQHRRIFPRSQRGITSVLKRRIILLIEPFMEHGEDWSMEKIARSQWEQSESPSAAARASDETEENVQ
jgi:hypothetical protein